jgi:hypothetical protein
VKGEQRAGALFASKPETKRAGRKRGWGRALVRGKGSGPLVELYLGEDWGCAHFASKLKTSSAPCANDGGRRERGEGGLAHVE